MDDNILLVPFIDESESFVLGFEAGQLWGLIKSGENINGQLVHNKNLEQIRLILKLFFMKYNFNWVDDTWSEISLYPTTPNTPLPQ